LSTCNSKILQNSWFELIVRWIMGIIFLFSCYHKIVAPAQFAKIIYGYYLFPDVTISLIAIILPFLELFAGLFLVLGIYPRSAVLIINAMLFAFMVAISINLATGHEFDCGCFSFGDSSYTSSAVQLLIRNIIFFILGFHLLLFNKCRKWCAYQGESI